MANVIQNPKEPFKNDGEKQTFNFLLRLPEECFLLREYRFPVVNSYKKPDFVVIHPNLGLLIIDAKEWSLQYNEYRWIHQSKVEKRSLATNKIEYLEGKDVPFEKADIYYHEFKKYLKKNGFTVPVTSVICFPLISRQEFINNVGNTDIIMRDDYKFYINFSTTVFRDHVEECAYNPMPLLKQIAQSFNPKMESLDSGVVEDLVKLLIPDYMLLGENKNRIEGRKKLKILTDQQIKWVQDLSKTQNYLLDLPGSGKTTVLVSKALYINSQNKDSNILIVTYSSNLKENLDNYLASKVNDADKLGKLKERIRIFTTKELIEIILQKMNYGKKYEELKKDDYLDLSDYIEADSKNEFGLKIFDYLLIDEIQDFDNETLYLLKMLQRKDNFFFAGDISQKIFERVPDLRMLGYLVERISLPKSYQMYRTPPQISKLALSFLLKNQLIETELKNNNYDLQKIEYKNILNTMAVFRKISNYSEILELINVSFSKGFAYEEIMIITSEKHLKPLSELIKNDKRIGGNGDKLTIVNFENSKGLERRFVIIWGIEDLYSRSDDAAAFDDEITRNRRQTLSERKIFIAITRTLEELLIIYSNENNIYVRKLLQMNRELTDKSMR